MNLFCLSCTLGRAPAWLGLGLYTQQPSKDKGCEAQGSHSDSGLWQGGGGVGNALPVLEGAKLGRMDTAQGMMVWDSPPWPFLTISPVAQILQEH